MNLDLIKPTEKEVIEAQLAELREKRADLDIQISKIQGEIDLLIQKLKTL